MSARQRIHRLSAAPLLLTALSGLVSGAAAQEAIGVPFVGRTHISFYTTELSRDGLGDERAAILGGVLGRRFGDHQKGLEISTLLRAGARSFGSLDDGIVDAGGTVAATHSVPGLTNLSFTASAGIGVMFWGQGPGAEGVSDTGRASTRVPLSAGAAYDIRLGRAVVSPFATLTTAYSREGDYVNDERVALDTGWRVGNTTGVSVRFSEMVLSLADVRRERGLPHSHRLLFSVGMSW